ncbi:hypothetical protein L9F63_001073, partial [Diploptera punctata]
FCKLTMVYMFNVWFKVFSLTRISRMKLIQASFILCTQSNLLNSLTTAYLISAGASQYSNPTFTGKKVSSKENSGTRVPSQVKLKSFAINISKTRNRNGNTAIFFATALFITF